MNRWVIQVAVMLVSFAGGLALATLAHRRQPRPISFSVDGLVSSHRSTYHSSDGQTLRYSCSEYGSPSDAQRTLQRDIDTSYTYAADGHLAKVGLIDRTATLDADGNKTGERVVLEHGLTFWTEGSRIHRVEGSAQHALLFQNSRAWEWEGCTDVTAFQNTSP